MTASVRAIAEALGDDVDKALRAAGAQSTPEPSSAPEPDSDSEPYGPELYDDEEREFWSLLERARVPFDVALALLHGFRATKQSSTG